MAELEDLVYAAGGEVVGTIVQILPSFNPSTLMGSGKVTEIKEMADTTTATLLVVDHQLSGSQMRNLEAELGIRVIDRSQLILDIFASRAQTYEGKLQVELAQMLDQLPRMVGGWHGSLSRQAGGIGTRGPGESALELDRRRINERVKVIRKKLEDVKKNRQQHRAKRKRQNVPSFALIGYTNSGKSTLLNKLTQSQVLAKDQLFATLDPTTRQIMLPDVGLAVLTDTVGFIRKLPTQLIEAFKATLEESAEADILIHVIDLSSPQMERQQEVVQQLMRDLKWDDKPLIHAFNKVDVAPLERQMSVKAFPRVFVSAVEGRGLEKLKHLMAEAAKNLQQTVELYFSKKDEHLIYELGKDGQILKSEASPHGTVCTVALNPTQISRWESYLTR